MPVMGRFRLRREGRRAFLQSGFAVKGPVHSLAENLAAFARHCVCESRSAGVPSALCLKCSIVDFFAGTRKSALHLRRASKASADYFRGRSFIMRSLCYAGLALAFAFTALSAVADSSNIH